MAAVANDQTSIVLNDKEAGMLALAASQAAHHMDDPRYNGYWDAQTTDQLYALDHGEDTMRNRNAWAEKQFDRDTQQLRWCNLATLLDPGTYPKGWKNRE